MYNHFSYVGLKLKNPLIMPLAGLKQMYIHQTLPLSWKNNSSRACDKVRSQTSVSLQ